MRSARKRWEMPVKGLHEDVTGSDRRHDKNVAELGRFITYH